MGLVERANGFPESKILPERGFKGKGAFNTQPGPWLVQTNARQHRALGARPLDRFPTDRAAMPSLLGWARLSSTHPILSKIQISDIGVREIAAAWVQARRMPVGRVR